MITQTKIKQAISEVFKFSILIKLNDATKENKEIKKESIDIYVEYLL